MSHPVFRKLETGWRLLKQGRISTLGSVVAERLNAAALAARVAHLDPSRGYPHPRVLQIEASSNCNLRCPHCSLSHEVAPRRHLTPSELTSILDKLPFRPTSVSLNGIGEPLVNPNFFELVDILAARGIRCSLTTNGTLLVPRVRDLIVARPSISYVAVSCDGATKSTFESLRVGAKFETWKGLVRRFVEMAHERGPRPLETKMGTVVTRQNAGELTEVVRLAADLGFRWLSFADVVSNSNEAGAMALSDEQWMAFDRDALISEGRRRRVAVSFTFREQPAPPQRRLRCYQPWEYAMVSAEGDVLPCCAVVGSDKASVMGNVFRRPFHEIWNGDAFKSFRRSAARGTNELCRACPFY